MKQLPRRAFNSPLLMYSNFGAGRHVNLIRLNKPYANGDSYAIHLTVMREHGKMYKTFEQAYEAYKKYVLFFLSFGYEIVSEGGTNNLSAEEFRHVMEYADHINEKQKVTL